MFSKYFVTVNTNKRDTGSGEAQKLRVACEKAFAEDYQDFLRKVHKSQRRIPKEQEASLAPVQPNELVRARDRAVFELRGNTEVGPERHRLHYHFVVEVAHRVMDIGNPRRGESEPPPPNADPEIGLRLFGRLFRDVITRRLQDAGVLLPGQKAYVQVVFLASSRPVKDYVGKHALQAVNTAALQRAGVRSVGKVAKEIEEGE